MSTAHSVTGALLLAATMVIAPPRWSSAATPAASTFASAQDASEALFRAVRDGDRRAVMAILGDGDELVSCGDEARDTGERGRFVQKYQQLHRLVREPDGTTVLYVGAENWPFPIPLVTSNGRWRFDAAAGRREIMFRRIGADEATAIEVCRSAVESAKQAETPANGDPIVAYAQRLAAAGRTGDEAAFHGYRFLVRKTAGGGVTIVAYPAEYPSSGVMTFIVGTDGVVYERDLGPDTARVARGLKARPATGWRAAG